eukprot:2891794-Prymnesium_polylepis.1
MVCRMSGRLKGMHEAAPASASCLASRVACSVSLRTARWMNQDIRRTACVKEDPRDVKRVTGA